MDNYGPVNTTPYTQYKPMNNNNAVGQIKFETEPYHAVDNGINQIQTYNQYEGNVTYQQAPNFQQTFEQEFNINHRADGNQPQPSPGSYYNNYNVTPQKGPGLGTDGNQSSDKKPTQTPPAGTNYPCDLCGKVFSSSASMRRHRDIHSGTKKFSCDLCGNSYTQKHNLTKHMRLHTGEKPYKCTVCDKAFYIHHHLKNHMLGHTGEYPFTCTKCHKGFKHKPRLAEHMKKSHDVLDSGSTAQSPPSGLNSEDNSVSEIWTTEADDEDDDGDDEIDYSMLDDSFDDDQKYDEQECEVCQQIFISKESLETHMKLHSDDQIFRCDECSNIFLTRAHLVRHRKSHTGETIYECEECNVSFRFKVSLHIHMRRHNNDSKRYDCNWCNKYFLSKSSLKKHMTTHSAMHYECDICNDKFTQKSEYSAHMVEEHERDKSLPPKCKTCLKTFSTHSSLRKHEYTHLEVKPHKCDECGVSFAQKIQLRLHNKRHNGGVMDPPKFTVVKKDKNAEKRDIPPLKIRVKKERKPEIVRKPEIIRKPEIVPERTSPRKIKKKVLESESEESESEEEESSEEEEEESSEEEEVEAKKEEVEEAEEEKTKKTTWAGYRYPVCENCDKRFKKKRALLRHMKICKKQD